MSKSNNKIVKSKNHRVSHFKTLARHGLYGFERLKTNNRILKTNNRIVGTRNRIEKTNKRIVKTKNRIYSLVSYCFY